MPLQVQDQLNDSMTDALETKSLADLTANAIIGNENKTVTTQNGMYLCIETTQNEMCLCIETKRLFAVHVTYKFGFGNVPCHRIPTHIHRRRDISNDGSGSSFTLYLGKIYNTIKVCNIIHS